MTNWFRRVWHLVNRPRRERELLREMRDHRESMPDPSRFGDPHRFIEQSRDAWGWNWFDDAVTDLGVGVRTLRRSPSFTITATLILAFGIGINLSLYRLMQAALLRPPAIEHIETWVRFHRASPEGSSTEVPYPVAEFVREHNTTLAAVMVESAERAAWGRDAADQIGVSFVSANWFGELGYAPVEGRAFSDALDGKIDFPAVVLGYWFWQNRLGAAPNLVGTTAYIDRKPVTVVGIAAAAMPGLELAMPDVFIPIRQREYFYPDSSLLRAWRGSGIAMYGRLRSELSADAVRESLRQTMRVIAAERTEIKAEEWLEPVLGRDNFMRPSERTEVLTVIAMLNALTGLVLVVAATNLGNLVMSKATGRVRELGVRMALGARRARIVRQLVIESIPLVALGAAASLWVSSAVVSVISSVSGMPPYLDVSLDWRTAALAAGLGVLSLTVVGLLPAWKVARQQLIDAIKDGGQHVSRTLDRTRLRRLLMAAQVAGSCLLLVVAGMAVRSVQRTLETSAGFDYEHAAVLSLPLGRIGITGDAARLYWQDVKERVQASAEVDAAAFVTTPPLGGILNQTQYRDTPGLDTLVIGVDPDYFTVMRIPLISGRLFPPGDARAVIVSRRLALAMYGTLDVLGRRFPKTTSTPAADPATIVGIASDAHTVRVEANNVAELYKPLTAADFSDVYLLARARGDVDRLPPLLRDAGTQDARVIPTAHPMRQDFDRRMQGPRLTSAIAAGVGLLTLALACLGIFGMVSYSVALRTKEIGIRVALGARHRAVLRSILGRVLTPVTVGVAVGLVLAVPAGLALQSEPFYLEGSDPAAFVLALSVFAVAGAAAALWPAYRVLRRNPVEALKHP